MPYLWYVDKIQTQPWNYKNKTYGFFQVVGDNWLNKKQTLNNKYLEATIARDCFLHEWLQTNFTECNAQVITCWVTYNAIKK